MLIAKTSCVPMAVLLPKRQHHGRNGANFNEGVPRTQVDDIGQLAGVHLERDAAGQRVVTAPRQSIHVLAHHSP